MPWPAGRPRDPETNAKVGRPGRKHPEDCAHCASLRGKPSGNTGKRRSFTDDNEYKRVQALVIKERGKPRICGRCSTTEGLLDWALNHQKVTSTFRELGDGRLVSDDPYDYTPLCRKCHVAFDQVGIPIAERRGRIKL